MAKKVPGFTKIAVPGKDELRPNHRDAKPARGPLAYVGEGTAHVMDMGAPRGDYPWSPTASPARAGEPVNRRAKPLLTRPTIQPGIRRP